MPLPDDEVYNHANEPFADGGEAPDFSYQDERMTLPDQLETRQPDRSEQQSFFTPDPVQSGRPQRKASAAFVMLVRNKDVHGARRTIRQIEDRFNHAYQYPYVFLNDEEFTLDFKEMMRPMAKAEMKFERIPKEHWSYPEWISEERATQARIKMSMDKVLYGGSESYRHMCRYQSGFLVHHEAMREYDYFWRIEPDIQYSCDIDVDPFLYMQDNNKKYGFVISLYEYPNTIPSLWNATKDFMALHPHLLASDNALDLISNDGGVSYNYCHFWSNFEIVDARWMRGEAYQRFFEHLDRAGGFFYERWGDAPVHSIAAALLLPVHELHFFKEIGYFHAPYQNCPAEPELQSKCHCDPAHNINREYSSCTAKFLALANERGMVYPEEVEEY
ncbi:alpha 1,2-mannosyltransferase 2.4.1 [Mortierella alpina]|uniref:Alpha 1,2-mannosyltransferase 2.4.1 n=1 Tax=Mortierella alpina TaxID=64518 RepID=A0A9P6JA82_MORAP|nr:alpha 1,2-mannosyltransferase 2.4.1 [Mortierella alpina]